MITADIYSHVLPTQQKEAADKWDDVFGEDGQSEDDEDDEDGFGRGSSG